MPAAKTGTQPAKKDDPSAKKPILTVKNIITLTVGAAIVALLAMALKDKKRIQENMQAAIHFIERQGDNALYFYLAFTLIGVACLIPTTPMEFAGGFLFAPKYGLWMTLFYTSVAKLIANMISVLLARYIFKDWVLENVITRFELLKLVSTAVKEEPWKMAFLVRGSMVPLAVKNYGLGVMDMPLLPIAAFSCVFTTFYAFQNIYFGSMCVDLAEVFGGKKASADPGDWTATMKKSMPIVFNVGLVVFLVKAVKGQIKKQTERIQENLKEKDKKKE